MPGQKGTLGHPSLTIENASRIRWNKWFFFIAFGETEKKTLPDLETIRDSWQLTQHELKRDQVCFVEAFLSCETPAGIRGTSKRRCCVLSWKHAGDTLGVAADSICGPQRCSYWADEVILPGLIDPCNELMWSSWFGAVEQRCWWRLECAGGADVDWPIKSCHEEWVRNTEEYQQYLVSWETPPSHTHPIRQLVAVIAVMEMVGPHPLPSPPAPFWQQPFSQPLTLSLAFSWTPASLLLMSLLPACVVQSFLLISDDNKVQVEFMMALTC